jgi:hypothetical protein
MLFVQPIVIGVIGKRTLLGTQDNLDHRRPP